MTGIVREGQEFLGKFAVPAEFGGLLCIHRLFLDLTVGGEGYGTGGSRNPFPMDEEVQKEMFGRLEFFELWDPGLAGIHDADGSGQKQGYEFV